MLYLLWNKQIALRNSLLNKYTTPSCSGGSHMATVLSYNFQDIWSTLIQDPETTFRYLQLSLPSSWVLLTPPLEEACCFYPISWSTQISRLKSCFCRMCTLVGNRMRVVYNLQCLRPAVPRACLLGSLISTLLLEFLFSFVSSWKSTLESQPGASPSLCPYFIRCALLSAGAHKSSCLSTNSSSYQPKVLWLLAYLHSGFRETVLKLRSQGSGLCFRHYISASKSSDIYSS